MKAQKLEKLLELTRVCKFVFKGKENFIPSDIFISLINYGNMEIIYLNQENVTKGLYHHRLKYQGVMFETFTEIEINDL